LFSLTFILLEI